MDSTSSELLNQLKDPHPTEAWRRVVAIYGPLIFQWGKAKRLRSEDAADLVQDVFITLIRELPAWQYDPQQSFRGWLRTIVQHQAIDQLRRQARRGAAEVSMDVEKLASPDEEDLFVEQEFRQHVIRSAFDSLEGEFPAATWQAAYRQLALAEPAQQVALSLGISINSAYLAKSRVLAKLRGLLAALPQ